MSEKATINVKMDITSEIRELFKVLNLMEKESKDELKNKVKAISTWVAQDIKSAALYAPMMPQARRVAQTVRASKDRVPKVIIGGARGKFSGGAVSGDVLFGSEFGADPTSVNGGFPNGGRRFPYPSPAKGRGNEGYWIFPTLTKAQPRLTNEWHDAIDDILRNWIKGVNI